MTDEAPNLHATNLHATGLVLGTRGFLVIGPSGTGKSMLALGLVASARRAGLFAGLVADDQVMIAVENGRIVARRPASIAGLAEIRGAGIVNVETIAAAVMDFALLPVKAPFAQRMAPENEVFRLAGGEHLPLLRLPHGEGADPFDILCRLLP